MPKLLRSSETAGCGATIELDNGEVVYVSIAQTGVLVRRWGINGGLIKSLLSNLFGPKLYNESSVYKNAQTARALNLTYPEQASPLSFKNPVLAAFSNAIWHCSSAAEVCTVLNESVAKFPDAERAVAPPSRGQHVSDSAGNALIGPDDLLPVVARYATEAERILGITKEEALRRTEDGKGGRFPMEPFVRCLKDTQTHSGASYYARFAVDEDGDIGSIHHGWCFDTFANLDGHEVNLLRALRFADTRDGILSAFFASVILPTIGAYWHGLYDRDYQLIESPQDLNEAMFKGGLKEGAGDTRTILKTPLGLRIRRVNGNKSCKCLCLSETEGLLDIEFMVSADGRASKPVLTVLRAPRCKTLY